MAEFASKGVAGAGLGLGIAGTALALLRGGGLFGLGGGLGYGGGAAAAAGVAYEEAIDMGILMKESSDILNVTCKMYENELATRDRLYGAVTHLSDKICRQGEEIGALKAAAHYQPIITHKDIEASEARQTAALFKATCHKVDGEVKIPYQEVSYPPYPQVAVPYPVNTVTAAYGLNGYPVQ